jgi:predicted PurR-regulated permease PerM
MKELFTRIIVGAIVSAIVSAGVLYFAFDQSLRGVEKAVDVLDTSISENGAWIRENRNAIDESRNAIDNVGDNLAEKLDLLSQQISQNQNQSLSSLNKMAQIRSEMIRVMSASMTTTRDAITLFSDDGDLPETSKAQLMRLVDRLERQQDELLNISLEF